MDKELKFASRFPQTIMHQMLRPRNEYQMLFEALLEEDVDKLIENCVFFARSYSPSSIVEMYNLPFSSKMNLILLDGNYHKIFLADEIVAILLHEIGHAFNSSLKDLDGEFVADKFVKEKGYGRWLISALEKGVKQNLNGFEKDTCDKRIFKLKEF